MEKKSGLGKFIAGIAAGAALGVLFAPKSGKETREDVKKSLEELVKKVKNIDVKEVQETFTKKIEEIKKELADLDKEKVVSIAKEKAEDIKEKLEDLAQEAKEKATPVIQKSVDDLREKTISVLKGTIKKLETEEKKNKKTK